MKIKLFHITAANYHFQQSVKQALAANLDPFSVPAEVDSYVLGAIGIFTFYTVDSLRIR